jgi:DNA-binding protein HU-beta
MGLRSTFPLYFAPAIPYYQLKLDRVRAVGARDGRHPGMRWPCSTGVEFNSGGSEKKSMAEVKRLTQTQLIKELAGAVEVPNKTAKQFLTSFADIAVHETKKNGVFVIPGLGRLVRVERKARMGRNPATGEAIKIPAKKVVKFRVAKAVRDAIVPPKKK